MRAAGTEGLGGSAGRARQVKKGFMQQGVGEHTTPHSTPQADPQVDARVARWLPSLGDFVLLLPPLFLIGVMEGPSTIIEGDTGWHIRTGQWILQHHAIPHIDLFSYTFPQKAWFAWEWLWDAGAGWIFTHYGLSAVAMLSMLFASLVCLIVFRTSRRACGNSVAALAVVLLTTAVTAIHWSARPHMVTLVCVALIVAAIEARRGLWLLPLMTAVWVNIHGGFVAELALLGCVGVAALLRAAIAPEPAERRASLRTAAQFGAVALACLAASLLNPYGWQLHRHIWQTLTEYSKYFHANITEWQYYVYNGFPGICLILLAGLACGGAWEALRKRDFTPLVMLGTWFFLGMSTARNVPLFAIAATPWAARFLTARLRALETAEVAPALKRAVALFNRKAGELSVIDRLGRTHLAGALVWATLLLLVMRPDPPRMLRAEFAQPRFPVQAVNTLLRDHAAMRVFSTDEWGAYLTYRSQAGWRVFIDGRIDFYGPVFAKEFKEIFYGLEGWDQRLERYGVGGVLVPVKSSLVSTLQLSPNWEESYRDPVAVLFCRRGTSISNSTGAERERLARAVPNQTGRAAQRSNEP
jgi:hypothetical protein